MRALLLAAGLGTRLRPLTETTPKPLLPVNGKPLLLHHIEHLKKHGVKHILINTHYKAEQINTFVSSYTKSNPDIEIVTVFEEKLLGSAGTLKKNKDFFVDEEFFLVVYADNLTDINYSKLLAEHRNTKSLSTMAVYKEKFPEQKGIVEYDDELRINRFVEKPKPGETTSNYANAGIYVFNKKLFKHLEKLNDPLLDFGYHVFPYLLSVNQRLYCYLMTEHLLDIGTHENYKKSHELHKLMTLG
jgi:mannose-1-phosphate guanylyltransferase